MNKDLIYSAELSNDSGVDASPFLGEALTSIVEDLMAGEKVRGLTLASLLEEQVDLPELVAASIIRDSDQGARDFKAEIERRLRRELEDADITHDLAAELAAEKPEES